MTPIGFIIPDSSDLSTIGHSVLSRLRCPPGLWMDVSPCSPILPPKAICASPAPLGRKSPRGAPVWCLQRLRCSLAAASVPPCYAARHCANWTNCAMASRWWSKATNAWGSAMPSPVRVRKSRRSTRPGGG